MTVYFSDDFARANGPLGVTTVGGAPWTVLTGSVSVLNGQASAGNPVGNSTPAASIAVITVSSDLTVNASLAGPGACLYFRVADVDNWLRLRRTEQTVQVQTVTGYSCTETNYNIYCTAGGRCTTSVSGTSAYSSSTDQSGTYYSPKRKYPDGSTTQLETVTRCSPSYSTSTLTTYSVFFDKKVRGVVTSTLLSLDGTGVKFRVDAKGASLTFTDQSGGAVTVVEAAGVGATQAGIGSGVTPVYTDPTQITHFDATITFLDSVGVLLG